tara:strand:+ start:1060 stop:1635 length:576 start_codon:yes stop_codon:yes gene_type:complete
MKKTAFLISFLSTIICVSQTQLQFELTLGYSFQGQTTLDNQSLENNDALGLRLGMNYLIPISKNLYLETGIFGKYNKGKNKIETLEFTTTNLRLQLPICFGYRINKKWKLALGIGIENNKDFNMMNIKKEDNLRYDLLNKIVYTYNKKIKFTLYSNWMLSSFPDVYNIVSPRNGIYLGVIYDLNRHKNKQN